MKSRKKIKHSKYFVFLIILSLIIFKNDLFELDKTIVTRVVDGDTIVVSLKGQDEKVRLIGINTPESVHPDKSKNTKEGILASNYTKEKLEGKEIELEFDVEERDRYKRILAYVYVDGEMFNEQIVKDGYANVATYPPNVKYEQLFLEAERYARENQLGLWAD